MVLDKIDTKILKLLQQNGRITNLQLSTEIGLSPAPTLERVRKLEQAGYVKGYKAILNEDLLGFHLKTFVAITLTSHQYDGVQRFKEFVKSTPEITECHHVTGTADFLIKVVTINMDSYEKLIMERLSKMEEVKHIQTMVILNTSKQTDSI